MKHNLTTTNLKKNALKKQHNRPQCPRLRFSPTAWAKLLFLRDLGDTEIGGFGIAQTNDPLLVTDFCLIEQTCSSVSVVFDDTAVAEFFDQQVDRGLRPAQFARIWIHTHPDCCSDPSITDEETFARVFGPTDWAVMFILARGGQHYCRLQFSAGPGGALEIPVRVDFSQPFAASDSAAWEAEYLATVKVNLPSWLPNENLTLNGATISELAQHDRTANPALVLANEQNHPFFEEEFWYDF